ncbi:efflux RND transporter periplasmic adaptor subunit [Faucicola mancuniensis]|uniref:efflux RND transporter periplasmic adaptor subunit n=1 Tax=Faucicola mancuniensis TaxID=1309795 RepID=UPI0039774E41
MPIYSTFANHFHTYHIYQKKLVLACVVGLSMILTACERPNATQSSNNADNPATASTAQALKNDEIQLLSSDVITAKAERYQPSVTITGTLQASDTATVQSTVSAKVQQVLVKVGQTVKKGQSLVRLDNQDSENQLAQAQADVASAEAQAQVAAELAQKNKALLDQGFLSEMEYKHSLADAKAQQAAVKAKKAQLSIVQKQSNDTLIVATADGVIASRQVENGQVISPNQALMTIVNPNKLEFSANVPSETQAITVGQSVPFTIANSTHQFVGQVSRIAPEIDPLTRQLPIFIAVQPEQNGQTLKAGMFATGQLEYGQIQVGVLIPMTAVSFDKQIDKASNVTATSVKTTDESQLQSGMIMVIGQDHVIRSQPIEIIRSQDDTGQYLVTGIEQGTLVITTALSRQDIGKKAILK